MSNHNDDQKKDKQKKDSSLDPDPETLHKTDPQEEMKGPISSAIQSIKENAEKNDAESKEEADEKKDKNT